MSTTSANHRLESTHASGKVLAIEQGDLVEAADLIAGAPRRPNCENDRAAEAYYLAQLEVAQGRFAAAARRSKQALLDAPRSGRDTSKRSVGMRRCARVRSAMRSRRCCAP
jgi:hypothetical protein